MKLFFLLLVVAVSSLCRADEVSRDYIFIEKSYGPALGEKILNVYAGVDIPEKGESYSFVINADYRHALNKSSH